MTLAAKPCWTRRAAYRRKTAARVRERDCDALPQQSDDCASTDTAQGAVPEGKLKSKRRRAVGLIDSLGAPLLQRSNLAASTSMHA
ncbi:hypothetical protein [Paraburkholderia tropica]|uniref:hypothetical protein n=1 Tax=Paraburkholderia tropica TaxID=92647 RepID=UPI000A703202|nr:MULTISPECIES: hypothetical protein [Paraburkholderia]MBB2978458.1 hypothetical protein [Paraburkholderia tropica]MBB2998653.1 hypothetical protein [Paraburkholderia tropica]MBB6318572.1 hypothetical protein [Paraburkholderia tropica]QNB13883.1 hypothetical protein G5S35_20155 [Paraburkholderia tropica]RQM50115.1 hypothetical protein EHZ19_02645 [Paraburkholderia bannensis]